MVGVRQAVVVFHVDGLRVRGDRPRVLGIRLRSFQRRRPVVPVGAQTVLHDLLVNRLRLLGHKFLFLGSRGRPTVTPRHNRKTTAGDHFLPGFDTPNPRSPIELLLMHGCLFDGRRWGG